MSLIVYQKVSVLIISRFHAFFNNNYFLKRIHCISYAPFNIFAVNVTFIKWACDNLPVPTNHIFVFFYLTKFVSWCSSFSGKPYFSFPSAILFMRNAIFLARTLIVCSPSSSCIASPFSVPWMLFQYWLDATGIPQIVKYLLSSSKVEDSPPLLAQTTLAPTFIDLSKCEL